MHEQGKEEGGGVIPRIYTDNSSHRKFIAYKETKKPYNIWKLERLMWINEKPQYSSLQKSRLLHVGSCNICTNKRKSRVNPPLKFYFPSKTFPRLYNPQTSLSVPASLMALLMFVLSAWVSWGAGSRRWGSSLSQVAKIRTDGEWKGRSRERENEVLPLNQSRGWVEI